MIDTPAGPRPVEALQIGDLVHTLDAGPQPVAWVWNGHQPLHEAERHERPVLIRAGALGPGVPARDLMLSPWHGVLLGESGQRGALPGRGLAAAGDLTGGRGVRIMMGRRAIHWFNFACARHQIVRANGAAVESLLIGTDTLASMSRRERRDAAEAFPDRPSPWLNGPPVRPMLDLPESRVA